MTDSGNINSAVFSIVEKLSFFRGCKCIGKVQTLYTVHVRVILFGRQAVSFVERFNNNKNIMSSPHTIFPTTVCNINKNDFYTTLSVLYLEVPLYNYYTLCQEF